jgi:hypothetical protein
VQTWKPSWQPHIPETAICAFFTEESELSRSTDESAVPYSLEDLRVSDVVPVNAWTQFAGLGHLIGRYNQTVVDKRPEVMLDPSLVDIRDALIHGRQLTGETDAPLLLLKFSKPELGMVTVELSERLTEEKMREWNQMILKGMISVTRAADVSAGRPDQTGGLQAWL